MAGETTSTSIANLALGHLGIAPITSIEDDANPGARACKREYVQCRDELLRQYPWRFACKRAQVSETVDAPVFGFQYAYRKPADMLRLNDADNLDAQYVRDWTLEGDAILTDDSAPLNVKYGARIESAAAFDPLFVRALALLMAIRIGPALRGPDADLPTLTAQYNDAIAEGRKVDAIERPPAVRIRGSWHRARRGKPYFPWEGRRLT